MKFIMSITFVSMILLATASCTRKTEISPTQTSPQTSRIISASPSNTEIISVLGLADRLIAVDKYSQGIEGVPAGIPEIDFFYPDTEAVIGLAPDMIIANEINSYGVADNPFKLLGNLGIKVVQIPTSVRIEGIYHDIMLVAQALGVEENGTALVQSMRDEVENIATIKKDAPVKSIYFEISAAPTMVTFGEGTYLNEMIEIAGGENIFSDQKGWFTPSAEEIINRNPDIIFVMEYPEEDAVQEILNRRAFTGITAVKEKNVFAIDADSASRPSPNIMKALRQIAEAVNSVR